MDGTIEISDAASLESAGARADGAAHRSDVLADLFAILYGVVTTLVVHGYQFGRGNHTVYLLDPLRRAYPDLLTNDWFTTSTLQYHTIFGFFSGWLMKIGQIERAFVLGYVSLAICFNVAWFLIVRRLGASRLTYLLSVLLYYLSAGGAALGVYQFVQDSSFLPSNIANVAMLWGIYLWMARRYGWAGMALGIAGMFHLNHAVVALGLWVALSAWERIAQARVVSTASPGTSRDAEREFNGDTRAGVTSTWNYWLGTALVSVFCLANVGLALNALASRSGRMPLDEFVALYVKLRHPHHYNPFAWPIALWGSFLWPLPLAAALLPRALGTRRREHDAESARPVDSGVVHARHEAAKVFLLLSGLIIVALVGAGITFVSESLVQMSLYRFSIYVKLFSVISVAYLVCDAGFFSRSTSRTLIAMLVLVAVIAVVLFVKTPAPFVWWNRGALALFTALSIVPAFYAFRPPRILLLAGCIGLAAIPIVGWNRWLGMTTPPALDGEYLQICHWARDNTPKDAVFLVPPDEEVFRLHGRRAIVVNFKSVPQLSGELIEWRRRLRRVLGDKDLLDLPRPLHRTFAAIRERYESLPGSHLFAVAREYGAGFIVVGHLLEAAYDRQLVFTDEKNDFYVYDLAAGGT